MKKIIKYVISEDGIPILFSCDILHADVLQSGSKSAGFLILRYDVAKAVFLVKCFGESSSLKVKSKLEVDEKIIEDFFNC
jgi:hypothetical protein